MAATTQSTVQPLRPAADCRRPGTIEITAAAVAELLAKRMGNRRDDGRRVRAYTNGFSVRGTTCYGIGDRVSGERGEGKLIGGSESLAAIQLDDGRIITSDWNETHFAEVGDAGAEADDINNGSYCKLHTLLETLAWLDMIEKTPAQEAMRREIVAAVEDLCCGLWPVETGGRNGGVR